MTVDDSGSEGVSIAPCPVSNKCADGSVAGSAEYPFLGPDAVADYQFGRNPSLGSDGKRNISFSDPISTAETDSIRLLQKSYTNTYNKSYNSSYAPMERSAGSHDFAYSCYTFFFGALMGYFLVECTLTVLGSGSDAVQPQPAVPQPSVAPPKAQAVPQEATESGVVVSSAPAVDAAAVAKEHAARIAQLKAVAEEAVRKAEAAEEYAARAAAIAAEKKANAMAAAEAAKEAERVAREANQEEH
uniref:Uncharacterized protein n=1 Tax=Eutreptiella gymnastica TaxID=73025 RepID=A0A7S1HT05_9EUGL